jgi:hypothetical protein
MDKLRTICLVNILLFPSSLLDFGNLDHSNANKAILKIAISLERSQQVVNFSRFSS